MGLTGTEDEVMLVIEMENKIHLHTESSKQNVLKLLREKVKPYSFIYQPQVDNCKADPSCPPDNLRRRENALQEHIDSVRPSHLQQEKERMIKKLSASVQKFEHLRDIVETRECTYLGRYALLRQSFSSCVGLRSFCTGKKMTRWKFFTSFDSSTQYYKSFASSTKL